VHQPAGIQRVFLRLGSGFRPPPAARNRLQPARFVGNMWGNGLFQARDGVPLPHAAVFVLWVQGVGGGWREGGRRGERRHPLRRSELSSGRTRESARRSHALPALPYAGPPSRALDRLGYLAPQGGHGLECPVVPQNGRRYERRINRAEGKSC
jgi:hypothetical protein